MAQKIRFGTRERLDYRATARCARRTPSAYDELISRATAAAVAHGIFAHRAQLKRIRFGRANNAQR